MRLYDMLGRPLRRSQRLERLGDIAAYLAVLVFVAGLVLGLWTGDLFWNMARSLTAFALLLMLAHCAWHLAYHGYPWDVKRWV